MLLKALYDFALSKNLLEDPAFVRKPVRWIIQIDGKGRLLGAGPVETHGVDETRAQEFSIPKTTRPTGGGQVSDFLVDDIGALFNLNTKPQTVLNERATTNLRRKHEDFWGQIAEAMKLSQHSWFTALHRFYDQLDGNQPSFLKLDTSGTPKWLIRRADGKEEKLGSSLITFSVDGNILINDESVVRPYWREAYRKEMIEMESDAPKGLCLVTGQVGVPIARTHTPMVERLPKPARGTGAGLIGFNEDAFRSYGLEKSFNAPVSIVASKAYLAALQYLSGQEDHWLSIGSAWLCFWADKSEAVSGHFARLLRQPDSRIVREFMVTPWAGFEQQPNDLDRFIAITFSAAGPRIIVKSWLQMTVKDAKANFQKWFSDLEIVQYGETDRADDERAPLSIDRLACTTIRRKLDGKFDREKLNPSLISGLYRAALTREAPPIMLLIPVMDRLRANIARSGLNALYEQSGFALIKLIINRQPRDDGESLMQIRVFETDDPAYNCGRLLAIFDSLQRSAHGAGFDGATIAERYFGSASTTPNTAFSLLWKLHQHHLKKLRQQGDKGRRAADKIKTSIIEIMDLFKPEKAGVAPQFPRYFALVEQGRFALGFYQQMAARKAAIDAYLKKKRTGELKPDEVDDELDITDSEQKSD
jgi:CRISPR-associated protein Csd1